jgi:hypothetical protein
MEASLKVENSSVTTALCATTLLRQGGALTQGKVRTNIDGR